MRKIYIAIFTLLLGVAANAAEPGSTVRDFVTIPTTSASLARGGAYLGDALATELLEGRSLDAGVTYLMWSPSYVNERLVNASASFKLGSKLFLNATFLYGVNDQYQIFGDSGVPNGSFTPVDMEMAFSGAYLIAPSLSVSAGAKILSSTLSNKSKESALALDVLAQWRRNGLMVGGGIRNFGGKVKSVVGDEFSLPTSFAADARYKMAFESNLNLDLEADMDYYFCGAAAVSAGLQFDWKDSIFLRGGYHFAAEGAPVPSYAAVGAGLKFFSIAVDFSYVLASEVLGKSYCAAVRFCF